MPKTIKLEAHLSRKEFENRYRKARDPVLRSHYQIVWLISEGQTTTQAMEVTGYARSWMQLLARRYNANGPESLGDHSRPTTSESAVYNVKLSRPVFRYAVA